MAEPAHRDAVCPRIAFMPQGLGKNLYLELSVFENIDFFARLFGVPDAERAGRIGALLERHGPGAVPRPARRQALRRHEAEGRPLRRPDPRPRPAHPRRADHRRRSSLPPAVLVAHRPHPRRTARHERPGLHRLHGRGPALRLDHRHGRRPRHRHRHSRPAHGTHRRREPGGRVRRAAAGRRGGRSPRPGDPPSRGPRRGAGHPGHRPHQAVRLLHRRRTASASPSAAARSSASSAPTAAASPPR